MKDQKAQSGGEGHRYVVRTASEDDLDTLRALFDVMHEEGHFSHIENREGGREEYENHYRSNANNQLTLVAFCDDEPVGLLGGMVQYLMGLQYIIAHCHFLYVLPSARDGKAALLMISAFRQWAQKRGADELRFTVTSLDNIEKSHKMFEAMRFTHLGGNFAYPLSDAEIPAFAGMTRGWRE